MGGSGSGRGYQGGKDTTNDMRALDVRRLQRDSLLTPDQAFGWQWTRSGEELASIEIRTEVDRVMLSYCIRNSGGEWLPMEYAVHLEWTPCHLGGRRAWFRCPARGCGRRVAILYGGTIFACRHCCRLVYASQREAEDDRARRRAETLRRRLGWPAGIANANGGKPKGMHWRTFERLTAVHDACAAASLAGVVKWLEWMNRRRRGVCDGADG
ncbi:MAG: hypothetical protein RKP46_16050 [Candidatus Accumulibacter sp.]|uniref:hypothetical protein n=1 Tax=Accumulibacter sp. TaxID=2053492 RepID=UPI002879FC6A|nr:hypothetical protein [Accumulibacter sp.]MDS4015840.1 hypothetical protein [Accumulibacter sp.]